MDSATETDGTASVDRSGRTPDPALPPGARHFPCKNCGGQLTFTPGTMQLQCPYCGTMNDIVIDSADDSHLRENDFLAALEQENRSQEERGGVPESEAARCGFCGAVTTVNAERTSDKCPYCGNPLSLQNTVAYKLNIQAVLPFAVDKDKATGIYRDWLKSRWFAPNDFSRRATREEALAGCYMPYWTYDSATTTEYTGERGDAYYETVMRSVTRDGKTTMEPQEVRRIRWSYASGVVKVNFDDILVPASKSVPVGIQEGLQPWQLANLAPFKQEFLAGYVTETYQVSLRDGFSAAQQKMAPAIDSAIRRDIGGDEQRISAKQTQHRNTTFKHILLPVWLSAYAYGGKTYRFSVNAQTGKASGDRPYSVWKIAIAVIFALLALGAVFFGLGANEAFGGEHPPASRQEKDSGIWRERETSLTTTPFGLTTRIRSSA